MPLRRKKRRKKQRAQAEVNVGPFADIAFLLIIFFILTTTLTMLAGNELDIPAARESPKKSKTEQPTITLSAEGLSWGRNPRNVTIDELRVRLLELELPTRPTGKRIVVLNSAPKVSYQRYYEVMMAVNDAGGVLGIVSDPGETVSEDLEGQ